MPEIKIDQTVITLITAQFLSHLEPGMLKQSLTTILSTSKNNLQTILFTVNILKVNTKKNQ